MGWRAWARRSSTFGLLKWPKLLGDFDWNREQESLGIGVLTDHPYRYRSWVPFFRSS
jgi:hypothetical protein